MRVAIVTLVIATSLLCSNARAQSDAPPGTTSPALVPPEQTKRGGDPWWGLVIGGAGLFVGAWGTSCILGATSVFDEVACVPVIGPILNLEQRVRRDNAPQEDLVPPQQVEGGFSPAWTYWVEPVLTLAQVGGIAMFVVGLALPRRSHTERFVVVPLVHRAGAGLSFSGTF